MARTKAPKRAQTKGAGKEPAPASGGRPREIDREEVVRLHLQGLSGKAIARELNISPRSVRRVLGGLPDDLRKGPSRRSSGSEGPLASASPTPGSAPPVNSPSAPGFCPPNLRLAGDQNYLLPQPPPGAGNFRASCTTDGLGVLGMGESGTQLGPPEAFDGASLPSPRVSKVRPVAPIPMDPAALAAWRRRALETLSRKYLPGDLQPEERSEAVRELEVLLARCSPGVLPGKSQIQEALGRSMGPYLERRRRAQEEARRAAVYRLVNEKLPTDMPREDLTSTNEAIEALLAGRPEATAEQVAEEILTSLHAASRRRKQRKAALAAARRDFESEWDAAVRLLEPPQRRALRIHWERTYSARDQARIDFLAILEREGEILHTRERIARLVEERLGTLLKEVLSQ